MILEFYTDGLIRDLRLGNRRQLSKKICFDVLRKTHSIVLMQNSRTNQNFFIFKGSTLEVLETLEVDEIEYSRIYKEYVITSIPTNKSSCIMTE